ncbi:MAG: acetate--CoA ligase family protein [Candidatus Aminicenantes bacterium]|nr:acetate--CoA ligase family protein [Candidatus Aminicenantes bacterium]
MARLFEYQGKKLLRDAGIPVPEGEAVSTPEEARRVAERLGRPVVVKIQAWVTGRAKLGGIKFADTPDQAAEAARALLGMPVGNFVVDKVLVEEKLAVRSECFAGLVIDDAAKEPLLVFSSVGGTGVEEIASRRPERIVRLPVDIREGLKENAVYQAVLLTGLPPRTSGPLASILAKLYAVARSCDARSAEINPLILTGDDRAVAADCHMVIDDYAVYRHPELGIEIAREFDRPPTELEKIAYKVEEKDYRGTFYFLQMAENFAEGDNVIGFHGAGGGGSMMSMDAVLARGFTLANYCDTSGNPPASKVYRAAKIILSQPGIRGYFASGSGVASQEQYHSARGLVKAFHEEKIDIPAVIRLGGNYEEKACEILRAYLGDRGLKVEGYGRDDAPEKCAARLEDMMKAANGASHAVRPMTESPPPAGAYAFETVTGRLSIDHSRCAACRTRGCIEACGPRILKLEADKPVLAITAEDAKKGKCTECLACEIYCRFHEREAIAIDLPIPGLKEYRDKIIAAGPGGRS